MTARLKHCPFCGSIDGPELSLAERVGFSDAAHVRCRDCGAVGPRAWRSPPDDEARNQKAVAEWNQRND